MATEAAPPKNVLIETGPNEMWPDRFYLSKFFDDPDYVYLDLTDRPEGIQFHWATEFSAADALHALEGFIEENKLGKGNISLRHTFERRGTIIGGSNFLRGDADDIMNEVYDSEDRVAQFMLGNKHIDLAWGHAWPKNFHDIPTNEISLRFNKAKHVSRVAVSACMQETALPGLRAAIDVTLDEFASYEPSLTS